MKYSQLITLMKESNLSPEALAPLFSVANMTVRRWQMEPGAKEVPKAYQMGIVNGVYQMLIDGNLDPDSENVQNVLKKVSPLSFQAALRGLGVSEDLIDSKSSQQDKVILALHQIGGSEKRIREVDASKSILKKLKEMGAEWTHRITFLSNAIRSARLSQIDKLVAYGALFYLICPFDLIPDSVPVVGFIDDFGILGFAIMFYKSKYVSESKEWAHAKAGA